MDLVAPVPVVFVHVPKTAGTSISRSLGIRRNHLPWWALSRGIFEFGVVRNPWDHALSCWNNFTHLQYPGDEGFLQWCRDGFPDKAHPPCLLVDQYQRLGPHLDAVYLFEELEESWPKILKRCEAAGLEPKQRSLLHVANTGRGLPRPKHTWETIDLVVARQQELLDAFGYDYHEPHDA